MATTKKLLTDPYKARLRLSPGDTRLLAQSLDVAVASTGTEVIPASFTNSRSRLVYFTGKGFSTIEFGFYNGTDKEVTLQIWSAPYPHKDLSGGDYVEGPTLANVVGTIASANQALGWNEVGGTIVIASGGNAMKKITASGQLYSVTATVGSGTSTDALDATATGMV